MNNRLNHGFSLVELSVAMAILAIILAGAVRLMGKSLPQRRYLEVIQQLEVIKRDVLENMDCLKTLGIRPGNTAYFKPSQCAATVVLKDRFNQPLFPTVANAADQKSPWTITGRCDAATASLIVEREMKASEDIVNFKKGKGTAVPKKIDLFQGSSLFCHQYLSESLNRCDTAPYNVYTGNDSRGALCCRYVKRENTPATKGKSSISGVINTCGPKEVMITSSTHCAATETGSVKFPVEGKIKATRSVRTSVQFAMKGTGMGVTAPSIYLAPHAVFTVAPLTGTIKGGQMYTALNGIHGGFLTLSVPFVANNTLMGQAAYCRYHDWQGEADYPTGDYATTAEVLCCDKP